MVLGRFRGTPNTRFWTIHLLLGFAPLLAPNGGSTRV
jgi:hypothetical protein